MISRLVMSIRAAGDSRSDITNVASLDWHIQTIASEVPLDREDVGMNP